MDYLDYRDYARPPNRGSHVQRGIKRCRGLSTMQKLLASDKLSLAPHDATRANVEHGPSVEQNRPCHWRQRRHRQSDRGRVGYEGNQSRRHRSRIGQAERMYITLLTISIQREH